MFDNSFLDSLPHDPEKAAYAMCVFFNDFEMNFKISEEELDVYDDYIEAFAALEAFVEATGLPFRMPELSDDRVSNIATVRGVFSAVFDKLDKRIVDLSLADARERFRTRFGTVFLYEFSDGDLARVQALLNELRDLITESQLFDAKHRDRILKKFEALQLELHKKVSSLDRFWGVIGDAGVVLGKFGKDAKPLVDRMREIAQIIWRTQARAEELPSGTPFPLLSASRTDLDESKPNK